MRLLGHPNSAFRVPRTNSRAIAQLGALDPWTFLDARWGLGPCVGVGAVAPRPPEGETLDNGQARKAGPEEEAKGDTRLCALAEVVAVAVRDADADGHGDGAGEPEEGGDGEEAEGDDGEEDPREDGGRDGDVDEDEDRPDGVEEHEVEGRGGATPPERVGLADDCGRRVLAGGRWTVG